MREEYILVQEILKEYDITISQLAGQAGMADSTVYEYTGGRKKHLPLSIWRALYELTEDARIPDLITGDVESFIVPLPKQEGECCTDETLKKLIEKRKKDIECETAILDILADGQVNKEDWKAIELYKKSHPEALKLNAQIYYNIMQWYDDAIAGEK